MSCIWDSCRTVLLVNPSGIILWIKISPFPHIHQVQSAFSVTNASSNRLVVVVEKSTIHFFFNLFIYFYNCYPVNYKLAKLSRLTFPHVLILSLWRDNHVFWDCVRMAFCYFGFLIDFSNFVCISNFCRSHKYFLILDPSHFKLVFKLLPFLAKCYNHNNHKCKFSEKKPSFLCLRKSLKT